LFGLVGFGAGDELEPNAPWKRLPRDEEAICCVGFEDWEIELA